MSARKCPKCGSNRRVFVDGPRNWWCYSCRVAFDDDPNEGGTHSNDPTKRIEREEARAFALRNRREREESACFRSRRRNRGG